MEINKNYHARIARIDQVIEIKGADKIQLAMVLGSPVIVSKDWEVGTIGVFFPVDCQLSDDYCRWNNLYRDCEKNLDGQSKGFFDTNRKVRAQPFMKVKSQGYFTTLSSLDVFNGKIFTGELGYTFSEVHGQEVCRKFVSVATKKLLDKQSKVKKTTTEAPLFHKHVDTMKFTDNVMRINKGDLISIHAKLHGTSARYSYTKVISDKALPKWKQVVNRVGTVFKQEKKESWEYLAGSRNVVLYPDKYKEGFHGSEQFRFNVLEELKPYLDKGMTVYGEICGYVNGKPIMGTHSTEVMKNKAIKKKYGSTITYKYGCSEGESRFHIYRITYTSDTGLEIDFTAPQLEAWCLSRGFNPHYNVCEPFIFDGDKAALIEKVNALTEREELLTEDFLDSSHVSEGVIVRVDNGRLVPLFFKSKSFVFSVLEGFAKEVETFVDLEDVS